MGICDKITLLSLLENPNDFGIATDFLEDKDKPWEAEFVRLLIKKKKKPKWNGECFYFAISYKKSHLNYFLPYKFFNNFNKTYLLMDKKHSICVYKAMRLYALNKEINEVTEKSN